eukprot:scaffold125753_cov53-Phaeocystis_antarctica.AAC.6
MLRRGEPLKGVSTLLFDRPWRPSSEVEIRPDTTPARLAARRVEASEEEEERASLHLGERAFGDPHRRHLPCADILPTEENEVHGPCRLR